MTERQIWQMAFLKQAITDWEAYQRTRQTIWPTCHRLLFLQMATEKLSKALLLASHSNLATITQSDAAFVMFMSVANNNRKLQDVSELHSFTKQHRLRNQPLFCIQTFIINLQTISAGFLEERHANGVQPRRQRDHAARFLHAVQAIVIDHQRVAEVKSAAIIGIGEERIHAGLGHANEAGILKTKTLHFLARRKIKVAQNTLLQWRQAFEIRQAIPISFVISVIDAWLQLVDFRSGSRRNSGEFCLRRIAHRFAIAEA